MKSSKQMMLNFQLSSDSETEEPSHHNKQIKSTTYLGYKADTGARFDSKVIKKGIFFQEEEQDYHSAVVSPSPNPAPKLLDYKNPQLNQQLHLPAIKLLQEIEYDSDKSSQQQPDELQNQKPKRAHKLERGVQQKPEDIQMKVIGLSSPMKESLLNFQLDQSSEQGSVRSNEESADPEEVRRLLGLKFNELKAVTIADIATTHAPQQNMKLYTNKPVEMGKLLQVQILKTESFFTSLWPEYHMLFDGTQMLHAKKMFGSTTSNFYVTLQPGIEDMQHEFFAAKLRGNHKGNVYHVFSKGANPQNAKPNQKIRQMLATILFHPQRQNHEPRQFEVYALALQHTYKDLAGIFEHQQISLEVLYSRQENKGKIFHFRNRKPIYSEAIEGYILNFGGRVQKASVKNFILEDTIAHREVLMMGKSNDDVFRVDVQWPLKPLVAFCICLANFDTCYVTD